MSSVLVQPRRLPPTALRPFFWAHPEWWCVAACALAWSIMLVHAWQHAGHEMHHTGSFFQETSYWICMTAAMMLPFNLESIRLTAARSLWLRRYRAITGFLIGYLGLWLAAGVLPAALRELPQTHTYMIPACLFAFAAWWFTTRTHKRALVACHRRLPLNPLGWHADRDCIRFGATIGFACIWSCWPLMLACMFTGHGLIAMTGGMAIGTLERWSFRPRKREIVAVTLALAGYYMVLAGLQ
ncbi:MAG TPA: DUF2182 domain-containing protein [Bryobacteraceae bacterium]|nr:DUF2182 domain-containing protein [Bryobacteraceae bacterium]